MHQKIQQVDENYNIEHSIASGAISNIDKLVAILNRIYKSIKIMIFFLI